MIVCSCNVLSDHDIRHAVRTADDALRKARQIFGCLGCSAACGRCARAIKTIIDEALGACPLAFCAGCPHRQTVATSRMSLNAPSPRPELSSVPTGIHKA
jgi:bacterioferritin-associated ferredoxin